MFRVLNLRSGIDSFESTGQEAVVLPAEGNACWVDLENFDDKELALLQQRFRFHPLMFEDFKHRNRRPKIDDFDGYQLIILYDMTFGHGALAQFEEIVIFLGARFFVTVHSKPLASLNDTWKRVAADPKRIDYGPDRLLYLLLDTIFDGTFAVIDRISDALLQVENQIVGKSDGTELGKLVKLKRTMVSVRRVIAGERDVVTILIRRPQSTVSAQSAPFLRDVYDHAVRAYEQIDIERDLLGNAMDAYMSTISNRLNVVMKQLTILSAIFLPPTFITSFFGQNFSMLPFASKTVFSIEIAACFALPAAMLYWFYRRRWL